MTPGPMLGSKLTPGTLLRDYFQEPLPRLNLYYYKSILVNNSEGPVIAKTTISREQLHLGQWIQLHSASVLMNLVK